VDLDRLQECWIELFSQMRKDPAIDPCRLAAPFLSVEPDGYDPVRSQTILYIGKATGKKWYRDEFLRDQNVADQRERTAQFLRECVVPEAYNSSFWRFAWRLNNLLPEGKERPFQNIVWTNIAKIGVVKGNPSRSYLARQAELAQQTLIAEIRSYRPSLIVFVSGDYGACIVRAVFESFCASQDDATWQKPTDDIWWRPADTNLPAVMCANHPERKPGRLLQDWVNCAKRLLGG